MNISPQYVDGLELRIMELTAENATMREAIESEANKSIQRALEYEALKRDAVFARRETGGQARTLGQIAFDGAACALPSDDITRLLTGDWEHQSSRSKECWEAAALAVKAECDRQLEVYRKVNAPITGEPNDTP